jgi:hypothetical protein
VDAIAGSPGLVAVAVQAVDRDDANGKRYVSILNVTRM